MNGIDSKTGKRLSGVDHLRQSIMDILRTPIGSRVMLPEYGSRLFELIDAPINQTWFVDCHAAVAEALDRWEPRIKLTSVKVVSVKAGHPVIDIYGIYQPTGKSVQMEGLIA